jgi:hypothetical protein
MRRILYWSSTILIAAALLSGGAAYLVRAGFAMGGMAELGYPVYVVTLLGLWKLLGGITILVPRLALLKEWAYAGMAFDLTGAAWSQAASGHAAGKVIVPLVLLAIAAMSWALRPPGRSLSRPEVDPQRRGTLWNASA